MKTYNQQIEEIREAEKMYRFYSQLHDLLSNNEINPDDERIINTDMENGEITSLESLAQIFFNLSSQEFNKTIHLFKAL